MCGICGIVWNDSARVTEPGLIKRMADRLRHRGPDGEGFLEQPGVSLGHRRLSIIDLAGGAQPIANEDETVWVTFNGEIYNFLELRPKLEAAGHRFRTHSDTEVLVHLYEQHGPAMLDHLRGMFAFAIWDARDRSLFLARDRLGKKPLVYWNDDAGLRFASELKALTAEPGFGKSIDPVAIDDYLTFQYIPHPRTIYKEAFKLPPAHYAVYRNGRLEVHRYWKPGFDLAENQKELIDQLRAELTEATRLRMIADVPLGAFLSGGIDSTIIVGLMRQLANAPVKTFSIGFRVPEFDETSYARLAARHLGTEHTEFIVEPKAVEDAERLAWFYDEPFADSSAIPTYHVSKLTRQQVTVALTGDAGDELFAGYSRYRAVRLAERFDRLPAIVRKALTSRWLRAFPTSPRQKSKPRQLKKFLAYLAEAPQSRYRQWISIFDDASRRQLYTSDFASSVGNHRSADLIDRLYDELPGRDFVTRTTYVDLLSYLPCDLLTKVDSASMANSLECRGPFLDHKIVELAGRLHIDRKIKGGMQKYVLKRVFADFLPGPLFHRPKMGFGVPIDSWLRHELRPMVEDLLLGSPFREHGWFEPTAIRKLVDDHLENRWDHSYRLWALIMLELWYRNHMIGE